MIVAKLLGGPLPVCRQSRVGAGIINERCKITLARPAELGRRKATDDVRSTRYEDDYYKAMQMSSLTTQVVQAV